MSVNQVHELVPSRKEVNIQDIIRDRKVERRQDAEQKRQTGLVRIQDMKSTSGINPLERFPKEIWAMLFDDLDPEDRGNASQVHPEFHDLMAKHQIRDILFPQILKVCKFQYWFDQFNSKKNYSRLRGVSRSMRDAVDRWIKDNLKQRITLHGIDGNHSRNSMFPLFDDMTYDREIVQELLDNFGGKIKKRFFPRALSVTIPYVFLDNDDPNLQQEEVDQMFQKFKNDVSALLKLIGDQIWHFGFFLFRVSEPARIALTLTEMYMLLQQWTSLLPNMKWLELEAFYPAAGRIIPSSVFQEYPFPHLTALERICFKFDHVKEHIVTSQLCKVILEVNQHVKVLNFEEADDARLKLLPAQLIQSLPVITFLVVNDNDDDHDDLKLSFQWIQPMINLNWNLKTIKLHMYDSTVSINELLQLLGNFPTLENASLSFLAGVKIGYDGNFGYLKLPNLTNFELKMCHPDINYESNIDFLFSLQFLLHSGKLKTLNWTMRWFDDCKLRNHLKTHERHCEALDFRAGLRTLYDSNIWDVFPCLENVKVEGWRLGNPPNTHPDFLCYHEYRRKDIAERVRSLTHFLKNHRCCRFDNQLQNCVMLFG